MPQQPVNALAPFEVGNGVFSVDQFGNVVAGTVETDSLTFADGTAMNSAGGSGVTIASVLQYIMLHGLNPGTPIDVGTY